MLRQNFSAPTTLAGINKQTRGLQPRPSQSWRICSIVFVFFIFFLFFNFKVDELLDGTLCITGSDTVLSSILLGSR
jgi:hypothetical protein